MIASKILVVDDEEDIRDLLCYNFEKEGYQCLYAANGDELEQKLKDYTPNLIILDIMMPGVDGIELCRRLRTRPEVSDTLIAFLTAQGEEYVEVAAFDAGADDFIRKPIRPRALLKRVRALLKRGAESVEEVNNNKIYIHDLVINLDEYSVTKENTSIVLTRREFELLYFLASRAGKVFDRKAILNVVWPDIYVTERTIDVHIRKLRQKIGEGYIKTLKGVGYKFLPDRG